MGKLKSHKDMDVWQIAEELKDRVMEVLQRPRVVKDVDFCDQIRRSARSAPSNLSEAFWRYRPMDKARFVEYAIGSLGETQNHLGEARKREYIDEAEHSAMESLAARALSAAIRWHAYLETCPSKPPQPENRKPTANPKPTGDRKP